MNSAITVALVEDSSGICQELEHLLSRASDLQLVAICRNAATALRRLPELVPDVIIMDIELPGQSGIECTRRLKEAMPLAQILMFTIHDGEQIIEALEAGAIGYLLKSASPEDILQAVREAYRGGAPMTTEVARKVVESFHRRNASSEVAQLTMREREVIQLLAKGRIDKQIADQLAISLQTVNSHLKHIYAKLGVRSRTEAVVKFIGGTRPPPLREAAPADVLENLMP